MSTSKAVARGTTRLLAGVLSAKTIDFVFYLVLARQLGVEEFGRYVYAISFTLLFAVVADLGVCTVVTREAARNPHRIRELLRYALVVKSLLALVALISTLGISIATHASRETMVLVAILTVGMLFNSLAFLFESVLRSAGRAGKSGLTVFAQSVVVLAIGSTLVFGGGGALGGACAYCVASVVHLLLAARWSHDLWRKDAAAPPADDTPTVAGAAPPMPLHWRAMLRESAPLALSGVFIAVYFRMDSVLLRALVGERAVGLYGAVYRFFEAFVLFSAAYRSVLFPIMARAADGPADALGVLCRKSMRLHLLFTIGIAVFFSFKARAIVTLLLGPSYAEAAPALALLIWALPFAFMADTLLHLLAAQRRQHITARVVGTTAAFNVTANLALIPILSLYGAALVTVASEVLAFALMYRAFQPTVQRIDLMEIARAPVIAGAIACVAIVLVTPLDPGGIAGLLVVGLFAASAYLLALIWLGAVNRRDAELVAELLPRALRPAPVRDRKGKE